MKVVKSLHVDNLLNHKKHDGFLHNVLHHNLDDLKLSPEQIISIQYQSHLPSKSMDDQDKYYDVYSYDSVLIIYWEETKE